MTTRTTAAAGTSAVIGVDNPWPSRQGLGGRHHVATDKGGLFLAVVIDLFSRQVVGWSLRRDMARDIVIDALRMAWFKRHPGKDAGQIFHSERGRQPARTSAMCWPNTASPPR